MATQSRGHVDIDGEECKGCGLCLEVCPPEVLEMSTELSPYGVHSARYKGEGCTGCGVCYYCCPEPGAITVYRASRDANDGNGDAPSETETAATPAKEVGRAPAL